MKNLKKGDILKCVNIHHNTSASLTMGKSYPIIQISRSTYDPAFYILDDKGEKQRFPFKRKMFKRLNENYLPEIIKGQKYKANDGEKFELIEIKVANIMGQKDYLVVAGMQNVNNKEEYFETNIERLIGDLEYTLIK